LDSSLPGRFNEAIIFVDFTIKLKFAITFFVIASLFVAGCAPAPSEVTDETESDLPISYFKDSLIEKEQVIARLRLLDLEEDSVRFEWDGYTMTLSYEYFAQHFKHVTFPSLIRLNIPADAEMRSVNLVFEQLIEANCLNLAFEVTFQGDTALLRHTLGKKDIPFNCCFERRNKTQKYFNLNDSFLAFDSTDVEIRNELDSFYLKNMVAIDSAYVKDKRLVVEGLSKERDSCLDFECASLHQQEDYGLVTDSTHYELIGSYFRPTANALIEFKLDEDVKFQDFMYLLSAHENWLWGKRRSLSILHFNKTYMQLLESAKRNSDIQKNVYVIRAMAPYRLRYSMD